MDNKNITEILIIEDDIQLTFFTRTILEREGYCVKIFNNGTDGLHEALKSNYSLILLDLDLPGTNGITICKKIKQVSDVPIIIFTGQNTVHEKVEGLDSGACDYITKPVEAEELLARVRAQLRKPGQNIKFSSGRLAFTDKVEKNLELVFYGLKLNPETREVSREDTEIHLSPKEFDILYYFMKNPFKTLTKQQVFEEVWRRDFYNPSDNKVVDEHINKLRRKLHLPEFSRILHNIYGVGHILKI
jgi:two-component system response regulator ResD